MADLTRISRVQAGFLYRQSPAVIPVTPSSPSPDENRDDLAKVVTEASLTSTSPAAEGTMNDATSPEPSNRAGSGSRVTAGDPQLRPARDQPGRGVAPHSGARSGSAGRGSERRLGIPGRRSELPLSQRR